MEKKTYKLWVARDKNGFLFAYEDKPTRCDIRKEWFGRFFSSMQNSYFPNLTWKDEPIEVKLQLVITDLDIKTQKYANKVTDNEEVKKLIINAYKDGYSI